MWCFSKRREEGFRPTVITMLGKIMAAIDDLKAALQRVADGAAEAQSELQSDAQQIKDLTAKLAAMPAPAAGTSDADVEGVVSQLNAIADALPKKVQPVVDTSAQAASAPTGGAAS